MIADKRLPAMIAVMVMPGDMKALIEQYATLKPRLYQIANYFAATPPANLPFAFDVAAVAPPRDAILALTRHVFG